jgi:predicted enzyme related to lactoylglutathione lyase
MVHGTAVVWLPVSDLDRAVSFYRDHLGLEQLQQDDGWAQLDANGLHIGLNSSEEPRGDGGAVIAFQPRGGLESTTAQLREAGVQISGEISEHPWGRIVTFEDPDGNDLQLYEPPAGSAPSGVHRVS